MIVRVTWIGLLGVAVALAQPPAGPGGRRMGPPPGGAFQGGRFLGAEAGMRARVVKNAPFTADIVTETTQTLADGNHINQTATVHFSRDSSGRTRREQSLNHLGTLGTNRTVVFINDPVAGASYALMPDSKTATRSVRPTRGGAGRGPRGQTATSGDGTAVLPRTAGRGGRGAWNNQNVKTESLGTQMIEGVQAQGTRTTLTIPAGQVGNEQPIQVVTERWYSPELQVALMVKRTDPRGGQTVTQYTNISRAEPVPTQFQVPSDYTVKNAGRGAGSQQ